MEDTSYETMSKIHTAQERRKNGNPCIHLHNYICTLGWVDLQGAKQSEFISVIFGF